MSRRILTFSAFTCIIKKKQKKVYYREIYMTKKLTRRKARESAVRLVYAYSVNKDENLDEFFELAVAEHELEADSFTKELFFGVCRNWDKLDAVIADNATGWKIGRISKISLAVMRICAYELLYTDVPKEIAINEALEIDKAYDDGKAPSFINGILNAIAKSKAGAVSEENSADGDASKDVE